MPHRSPQTASANTTEHTNANRSTIIAPKRRFSLWTGWQPFRFFLIRAMGCLASLPCQSSKANEIVVSERDIKTPTTFAHEAKIPLLARTENKIL